MVLFTVGSDDLVVVGALSLGFGAVIGDLKREFGLQTHLLVDVSLAKQLVFNHLYRGSNDGYME